MSRYNVKETETRWQGEWDRRGSFAAKEDPAKPKYYVLEMFPYPSGRIHMGHVRNYTLGDVVARYKPRAWASTCCTRWAGTRSACRPRTRRAIEGHPPGELDLRQHRDDARAAEAHGPVARLEPRVRDLRSRLLRSTSRSCSSTSSRAGLVYRKEAFVNWDPVDHTVLANEQVIDGRGWRSGAPVEKRKLTQWFFRITDYADELLDGAQAASTAGRTRSG